MKTDEKLLALSTIYDNIIHNTSINTSYQILLTYDSSLKEKIIKFINIFIEEEKEKIKNGYNKNPDILLNLNNLKETLLVDQDIELSYLKAVEVCPKIKTNLKDYIKSLICKEIEERLEFMKNVHPEIKGEIYGTRK